MIDSKVLQLSVLLWFGLLIPLSAVHELGHTLVCAQAGSTPTLHMSFSGLYTDCRPSVETLQFYVTGPVFGALASVAIVSAAYVLKRTSTERLRTHAALMIAGLSFLVDQIAKIFLEGFATKLYEANGIAVGVGITVLQLGALIGFAVWLGRTKHAQATMAGSPK